MTGILHCVSSYSRAARGGKEAGPVITDEMIDGLSDSKIAEF
jgi:hypothetical protein